MSKPSEGPEPAPGPAPAPEPLTLRDRLIGLGEHSHRKSYYPELQLRTGELERFRVLLDQAQDGILLFELPQGRLVDLNVGRDRSVEPRPRRLDLPRGQ